MGAGSGSLARVYPSESLRIGVINDLVFLENKASTRASPSTYFSCLLYPSFASLPHLRCKTKAHFYLPNKITKQILLELKRFLLKASGGADYVVIGDSWKMIHF